MTPPTKCPVCGSELKTLSIRHVSCQKHKDALKKKNIDPSQDPTLELINSVPAPPKLPKSPEKPVIPPMTYKPIHIEIKPPDKEASVESEEDIQYSSEEYMDLDIPTIPESPKKEQEIFKLKIDLRGLIVETGLVKQADPDGIHSVLVNCGRCNGVISIPVIMDLVHSSELPIVPISYIHNNKNGKDQHCITLHLDHDFDIRRQKISDVIIQK